MKKSRHRCGFTSYQFIIVPAGTFVRFFLFEFGKFQVLAARAFQTVDFLL
jgi:hypothetical protein